jgi:formate/nitrite transporter FocA (FNT family)
MGRTDLFTEYSTIAILPVLGFIEFMVGFLSSPEIGSFELGHFLLWVTLGNMAGGGLFAVLIRYSVPLG